jgi:hypothetical protein
MICRSSGQGWELVRQPDHGVLACTLLDAIVDAPRGPLDGFRLAVAHHDDGWAARDSEARTGDGAGPESFLELSLPEHLEVSGESVRLAGDLHPYAEAIVALHGAWLHGSRVVQDPELAEQRDAVIGSWRALAEQRAAELGVPVVDLHHDQRLCAMVDFMSLWLCGWPDGDELALERPEGAEADIEREGDRVRMPAELLRSGCDVVIPVLSVAGTAPFPMVGETVRTISLVPSA